VKFSHLTTMLKDNLHWRRASSGCTDECRVYVNAWWEPIFLLKLWCDHWRFSAHL